MKPYQANLLCAVVLIAMGLWAYFGAATQPLTALIPVGFGVIFLASTPALKKENKIVAHVVVVLMLLIILALTMPLIGSIKRGNTVAIVRVGLMLASAIFAMAIFVKSFIDARKAREG